MLRMYVKAKKHQLKQPVEKLKSCSTDLSEVLYNFSVAVTKHHDQRKF